MPIQLRTNPVYYHHSQIARPFLGLLAIERGSKIFRKGTMSAEGVRTAFSSPASAPAVLQRALSKSGEKMVAVEGTATIPGDDRRQGETERPKPAATTESA